jgi:probable H4MPT-linked C1 transfer pathway protein
MAKNVHLGWDIGGAHLKAARAEHGRIVAAAEAAPLWQGLDSLHAAFGELLARLGPADAHAITMTGELCDAFASRREGVIGLAEIAARHLGNPRVYAGRAGFVALADVAANTPQIASANWRASAAVAARFAPEALLIDIGSTTTDLVPVVAGKVAALGDDDAGRLETGELVYTGLTRSFVMAMATRAPFAGRWTPLMNEYFAAAADVRRALGDLPADADLMPTADGREKTAAASRARLARMIGREAADAPDAAWERLAAWFAEAQLREICDAAHLRLSRGDVARDAPVVAAGVGAGLAAEVARRLGRACRPFVDLIGAPPETATCVPAAAIALLIGAEAW